MKRSLSLVLFLLLLSSAAGADWLAFKDGTTRQIVGPWKVQGRRVIFKALGGTLSAVNIDEVDLSVSEQLTKNAEVDRGLVEIRSSPTDAYTWRTLAAGSEISPTGDGGAIIDEWSIQVGNHVGAHPGLACIPSRLVGISSGTDWWLQTGTRISKFRPIGLAWADADHLRALVPNGLLCFEADAQVKSPDPAGHLVGYARLADGRDIGFELLRTRAARMNSETFSHRKIYLAATE